MSTFMCLLMCAYGVALIDVRDMPFIWFEWGWMSGWRDFRKLLKGMCLHTQCPAKRNHSSMCLCLLPWPIHCTPVWCHHTWRRSLCKGTARPTHSITKAVMGFFLLLLLLLSMMSLLPILRKRMVKLPVLVIFQLPPVKTSQPPIGGSTAGVLAIRRCEFYSLGSLLEGRGFFRA